MLPSINAQDQADITSYGTEATGLYPLRQDRGGDGIAFSLTMISHRDLGANGVFGFDVMKGKPPEIYEFFLRISFDPTCC